jgi:hypothetical protein
MNGKTDMSFQEIEIVDEELGVLAMSAKLADAFQVSIDSVLDERFYRAFQMEFWEDPCWSEP